MEVSWVYLKDEELGHLMEMLLETPKEMSSAYSLADLMVFLTESCLVQPMEKGLEQQMAIQMVINLVCLSAVLMVKLTVLPMESDSDHSTEFYSGY